MNDNFLKKAIYGSVFHGDQMPERITANEYLPYWHRSALERIARQQQLIETLAPSSPAHRTATEILLLFQDTLHSMITAVAVLQRLEPLSED